MAKLQTLADVLGLDDVTPSPISELPDTPSVEALVNLTGDAFAKAVLESREFRLYIVHGLTLGDLPPAVLCRLIDHGWGRPPERVEHTGRDGAPIETITEVRRVVVYTDETGQLKESELKHLTH